MGILPTPHLHRAAAFHSHLLWLHRLDFVLCPGCESSSNKAWTKRDHESRLTLLSPPAPWYRSYSPDRAFSRRPAGLPAMVSRELLSHGRDRTTTCVDIWGAESRCLDDRLASGLSTESKGNQSAVTDNAFGGVNKCCRAPQRRSLACSNLAMTLAPLYTFVYYCAALTLASVFFHLIHRFRNTFKLLVDFDSRHNC
jgi:hypothetical protein